jgi:hypothetical protein
MVLDDELLRTQTIIAKTPLHIYTMEIYSNQSTSSVAAPVRWGVSEIDKNFQEVLSSGIKLRVGHLNLTDILVEYVVSILRVEE